MEDIVKGYKATDKNMQCRGFQFELGVWHKHDGEIAMCESGFHFCEYPSGPWSFYSEEGTRIFKVEARGVIKGEGPGSDLKHVAREIMLTEEITPQKESNRNTGNWNTGHRNTGDWNTGHRNTGNRNTGDGNTGNWNTGNWNTGNWNTGNWNTGDGNTGDWNTGNWNTGHRNTGDWNTGNWNTGNRNTGDGNTGDGNTGNWNTGKWNTGHRNTGNWNTGDGNTGNWNTGDGNATDRCGGFLCIERQPFIIFDSQANKDDVDFYMVRRLCQLLSKDEDFDCSEFLSIPNATEEKIKALHKAHIERRAKK